MGVKLVNVVPLREKACATHSELFINKTVIYVIGYIDFPVDAVIKTISW